MMDLWAKFLNKNWDTIILTNVLALVGSALFGYWYQGITTNKWDISTLWTGIASVATAAATLWGKYWVKSKFNTPQGKEEGDQQ